MGFLRRWLGGSDGSGRLTSAGPGDGDDAEWRTASDGTFDACAELQRVSLWLRLYDADFENAREQQLVFALENRLMRALDEAGVGEHDTNSLERGFFAVRLVGDDAEAIVRVVLPLLGDAPLGSYLAVRRGPAGVAEERLELGGGPADGAGAAAVPRADRLPTDPPA